MNWTEDRDEFKRERFTCIIGGIGHSVGETRFTVVHDTGWPFHNSRLGPFEPPFWKATLWHGNVGQSVDSHAKHETKEAAIKSCEDYLREVVAKWSSLLEEHHDR